MERLLSNPPSTTCIVDSVLIPSQPVLEFTLCRCLSRKELFQVVLIATERPPADFLEWTKPQISESGDGKCRLGIVDCFSDPRGWLESFDGPSEPAASTAGVPIERTRLDPTSGFAQLLAAVRGMVSSAESSGAGGKQGRTLVVLDSVAALSLRAGVHVAASVLYELSQLPKCSVLFALHADILSEDETQMLSNTAQCVVHVTKPQQSAAGSIPKPSAAKPEKSADAKGGEERGRKEEDDKQLVCGVEMVKKRDNGTVSSRADLVYRLRASSALIAVPDEHVSLDAPSNPSTPSTLGLSFNLGLSDKEKQSRAALLLPFQKHLALAARSGLEERGKTSGDLEDALQILDDEDDDEDEDEEEEEDDDDDDDDDPDDDLDI
eukprot:CAMPEP_0177714964 /NCGR_PEP_ID=MMETSP0484_2-20121128/13732_1 /TAXON_ID=354590 /ORGANISM="Rhodomonas lens, Strain RHODO" /LENGTH=378 /DNA_ID=CAMNT_0019226913 /DNA_START=86 /DNA_END=1222 /DNA_ORIENTATION=+